MKGGIGQLMKQAQQMQANMKKAQEEMASIMVTGESGAGMVRVTMNCRHQVQKVEIDDTMIGDDKDVLLAATRALDRRIALHARCWPEIGPTYSVSFART